ncbi:MAG: hypothetical protein ACXADH_02325 [Candidatus Kariarchaeaceae archaeon]|jgi:hypothetical protein
MANQDVIETSFNCKLCGYLVTFHINQPETYITKTDEKTFAGMSLGTYRVGHEQDGEFHVNVVTADHKGHWRGLIDSYSEMSPMPRKASLTLLLDDNNPIQKSMTFKFLLYGDLSNGLVFDIISPMNLLPLEIAEAIIFNIESIEEDIIQQGILTSLELTIGVESFVVWKLGQKFLVYILEDENKSDLVHQFFEQLFVLNITQESEIFNRHNFELVIQIIDEYPSEKLDVSKLVRLVSEMSVTKKISVLDDSSIPSLTTKTLNQASLPDHLMIALISLLSGQTSIMELLEQGYMNDFQEIIDAIDFIKRDTQIAFID